MSILIKQYITGIIHSLNHQAAQVIERSHLLAVSMDDHVSFSMGYYGMADTQL